MSRKVIAVVCGLVLFGTAAKAQITIEYSELPSQVGDTIWYKYNSGMATVSVGSSGGPHTWVFDTSLYAGWIGSMQILSKSSTPFASDFPDANLCYHESVGDTVHMYFYHGLTPSEYRMYGQGSVNPGTSYAQVYNPTCLSMPLPYTYGTTWDAEFGWADTMNDSFCIVFENTAHQTVDAWGMAQIPALGLGSFPCLRENSVRRFIMTTYMGGVPLFSDTSWNRTYYWFVENVGWVATAKSPYNDTTENFTESDCYTILVKANCNGIEEQRRGSDLGAALPTMVRGALWMPGVPAGRSARALVDISGRKVMDLAPGHNDLGRVVPGVYYVTGSTDRPALRRLIVTR